ncbi:hypothetical protein R3P38DRAFT_3002512 [Favolaschia claudopus]|uniref:CMP/dCMP-type deaminase domain-containing protein n=1 Tax=Favolaschia claudopus TaxID=2862362 RepID=A0AAW0ANU2_9AGAR
MSMKSQFYLSLCADAASKSTMYYQLGSVIVKGGKVISTGFNHQRPNYCEPRNGRPMSMHAEMASIFNATRGAAPALKQQVQPCNGSATVTNTTPATTTAKGATKRKEEGEAVRGGVQQGFRIRAVVGDKSRSLRGEDEEACVLSDWSTCSLSGSRGRRCL